jgi:hypothetical protein
MPSSGGVLKREQELVQQQILRQERSFSDVCVPELMALATQNKYSVSVLIRDLPQQWRLSDKVLVAVFPSFRKDVETFYAGKGKCMTEMFEPHQLLSIDNGARLTLLLKLADQYQKSPSE